YDFLQMDEGHLVYSRQRSDEHRLQHQSVELWLGPAGRIPYLPGDGHRHRHQLVHSSRFSLFAGNDYSAYLSGDLALGHMAGHRTNGGRRTDVAGAEMEPNRTDLSRIER